MRREEVSMSKFQFVMQASEPPYELLPAERYAGLADRAPLEDTACLVQAVLGLVSETRQSSAFHWIELHSANEEECDGYGRALMVQAESILDFESGASGHGTVLRTFSNNGLVMESGLEITELLARAFGVSVDEVCIRKVASSDATDSAARQELAATCDAAMMLLSDETDFEDKDCDVVRIIEGLGRVKAYVEGGGVPITVLDHLGEAIESTDRGDPAGTESKGGE